MSINICISISACSVNFVSTGDIYDDFHLYKLATYLSTGGVAGLQMIYFVARVGLVGCALEFLGRIGLRVVFSRASRRCEARLKTSHDSLIEARPYTARYSS